MVLLKPEKDPGVQLSGMTLGWRLGVLQTHLFRVCQVLVWHLTRRGALPLWQATQQLDAGKASV